MSPDRDAERLKRRQEKKELKGRFAGRFMGLHELIAFSGRRARARVTHPHKRNRR